MTNLDSILKSRDITWLTEVHIVKVMVLSVTMYGCESWTIKKAVHQRINAFKLVLETLESPLDCKEIKPVNPKGTQFWICIGKIDAEAEAPILCPHAVKNWLIGKDLDAGKDWRQEEKGMTEDEMNGWHHWLDTMDIKLDMSLNKLQQMVKDREAWSATFHAVTKGWTWLSNWIEKKKKKTMKYMKASIDNIF